jgi:CRP/FNR family cyclic AMP-dependent transcriptional regulator
MRLERPSARATDMSHEQRAWTVPPVEARPPQGRAMLAYLLDADDDLAAEFDVRTRHAVRQGTTVRVVHTDVGELELRGGFGLLMLDGLLSLDTCIDHRTATDLYGTGELIQPPTARAEELLHCSSSWRTLAPARLALLDREFATRARPWPELARALMRRASRHAQDLDQLRAIAGHPRLEVRLDLLFWHLAARWGRVEPGGIRLLLPLTHRVLGQLVAAERPSVSHALHRLMHAELVTGEGGDWHLHGSLEQHLCALSERGSRTQANTPDSERLAQSQRIARL